jgi:hypothetical protein
MITIVGILHNDKHIYIYMRDQISLNYEYVEKIKKGILCSIATYLRKALSMGY